MSSSALMAERMLGILLNAGLGAAAAVDPAPAPAAGSAAAAAASVAAGMPPHQSVGALTGSHQMARRVTAYAAALPPPPLGGVPTLEVVSGLATQITTSLMGQMLAFQKEEGEWNRRAQQDMITAMMSGLQTLAGALMPPARPALQPPPQIHPLLGSGGAELHLPAPAPALQAPVHSQVSPSHFAGHPQQGFQTPPTSPNPHYNPQYPSPGYPQF